MPRGSLATVRAAVALVWSAAGGARSAAAQPAQRSAAASADGYVTLRGADTVAVERVTRDAAGNAVAELRAVAGGTSGVRVRARTTARADGATTRLELDVRPSGAAAQRVTVALGPGDSATVDAGTGAPQRIPAAAGSVSYVNLSAASFEFIVRRARALAGSGAATTPTAVPLLVVGGPPLSAAVTLAGDSVIVTVGPVTLRAAVAANGRLRGLEVPSQGVRTVRVPADAVPADTSWVEATPPPPRDYAAPSGAPYTAEAVRVPNVGGAVLAGTLTLPAGAARGRPAAVVLTLTGSGPRERDETIPAVPGYAPFRQLADTLGRRGIGVLRLDDRGVGASGGRYDGATSRDFADDARAALAWLRRRAAERGDVDARRLALVGHSEGALVAPMVAADDRGVAAVVLMAGPARPGRSVSVDQQRTASAAALPAADSAARAVALARHLAVADSLAAAGGWVGFWGGYDPLPAARRVRAPVLVLHGAADQQVTPGQADTLAAAVRAGGNRDVTVRVFPATNHLFLADPSGAVGGYAALPSKAVRPEVLGAAADWLAARLRAR